jgi:hypothetical protein
MGFDSTTPEFRACLEDWEDWGIVHRDRETDRFHPVGSNRRVANCLSAGLKSYQSVTIHRLSVIPGGLGWSVETDEGPFLSACAALQVLSRSGLEVPEALSRVEYEPIFTVIGEPWQIGKPRRIGPLRGYVNWFIQDELGHYIIHSSPQFARSRLAEDPESVGLELTEFVPDEDDPIIVLDVQRWRYAHTMNPYPRECQTCSHKPPLIMAGDGFGQSPHGAERAWLSGLAAARRLYAMLDLHA